MASRLLFGMRIAPSAITVFLVVGFCVPSYIWLEPDITERDGLDGSACWPRQPERQLGPSRWYVAVISIVRTERYVRACRLESQTEVVAEQR